MKLYRLGMLPGFDSMLVFHAMAYLGMEGFVLVSPCEPIVTLGYFQDMKTGVDRDYCRRHGLGLMRREVGGGTTLLDRNQIFYQVILKKNNSIIAGDALALYRKFSQPVIDVYADLGIKVRFKEVNDLLTVNGDRKITGEGGANIGDCIVFVGGILLDFDYDTMSRVFPAPNEDYRSQLFETLQKNVTSVKRELGYIPSREDVENSLVRHFQGIFGSFEEAQVTPDIWAKARELEAFYTSEDFLASKRREQTGFKIASGVHVYENRHKATGGTIHTVFEVQEDCLGKVNLYGDFTFLPKERIIDLENSLAGTRINREEILHKFNQFFKYNEVECPGITPEDFTQAVMGGLPSIV